MKEITSNLKKNSKRENQVQSLDLKIYLNINTKYTFKIYRSKSYF